MKSARSQIDWNFYSPPSSLTTTQRPHLNTSSDSALVCRVLLIHGQFRIINDPNLHVCVHAGNACSHWENMQTLHRNNQARV